MAPNDKRKEPGMDHPTHSAATPRGRVPSGGELAGLGLFLAAAILIPLLAGILIASLVGGASVFIFIGLVVGIIAGILVVYTRARQYL
jgi:hypothetical protein